MFSFKKAEKPRKSREGRSLSQFGLFDVPNDFDSMNGSIDDDNDNDSDLEAELAAITSGSGAKPKRPVRKPKPDVNLDAMVAASMRDIPSDEDLSDDENDPELLNELGEIVGEEESEPVVAAPPPQPAQKSAGDLVGLLEERIKMYTIAEENAKKAGENTKARRCGRGIKTLKDLLKQAKTGRPINEDDIPPAISANVTVRPAPPPPQPEETSSEPQLPPEIQPEPSSLPEPEPEPSEKPSLSPENIKLLELLNQRKTQYKIAALNAKKSGDTVTAVKYIKIAKQFDAVINAVENGQPVDLSRMPGPPGDEAEAPSNPEKQECETQKSGNDPSPSAQVEQPIDLSKIDELPDETLITASTVLEALEQRLEKYKSTEQAAKDEGNGSKARRLGRIVKQYEQAIKLHKAGKPIAVDELPTPPGYGPIPVKTEDVKPAPPPPEPKREVPADINSGDDANQPSVSPSKPKPSLRKMGNQASTTLNDRQLAILLTRQKEFKEAALNAKKKGEIEQAKEYLRTAKQFDPLIEAANCGLPVDMNTVPITAAARSQLEDEYEMVMGQECEEDDSGIMDVMARLEEQLTKQMKMCLSTRDHHKALGDVAGTNRFEQLALSVTRDLDIIRVARRTGVSTPPQFHYETKNFAIVKSFTELADNDMELTIVRGINYACSNPKDIDTYVKFEFPYPQEEPYRDRTSLVKDTNNPEYGATFTIPIQRNARACQRVFKRHAIKFEVYSRGCPATAWCASTWDCCCSGLFRSDSLIGTVNVKLQPLETHCELHDSFDLMEGRKSIGGKLEIRIRMRNPMVTKQVEQLSEKWLIIDS